MSTAEVSTSGATGPSGEPPTGRGVGPTRVLAADGRAPRSRTIRREMSTLRLMDAASRLFIRHGYHATSVEQIVEVAGYTK
ncbi:MAG: helix-turn-helix domain-containing protein, partial [Actinomycetota bacterium]